MRNIEDVLSGAAKLLEQEYRYHDGAWWLFAMGKPRRMLTDDEVQWHTERNHKPFCVNGVDKDSSAWWENPHYESKQTQRTKTRKP